MKFKPGDLVMPNRPPYGRMEGKVTGTSCNVVRVLVNGKLQYWYEWHLKKVKLCAYKLEFKL